MTKNTERLTRLAEHVYPLEHMNEQLMDKACWITSDHPFDAVECLRREESLFTMMRWAIQQLEPPCQSAGCLAGYTCALFYDEISPLPKEKSVQDNSTVYRYARNLLGLTPFEARHLFTPARVRLSSITPRQAARAVIRCRDGAPAEWYYGPPKAGEVMPWESVSVPVNDAAS